MPEPVRLRSPASGESSRWTILLFTLFGVACLVVPAAFWWATTFTKRLDDAELAARLEMDAAPREVLHAAEELSKRFEEGRPGMDRWTAKLVAASRRPEESVRVACAWVMQYDAARPEFSARLREMVGDFAPLVRRNAATSLARVGDPAARPVLLAMLEPHEVAAPPEGGRVESLLGVGQPIEKGMVVARLSLDGEGEAEVLAELPGRVLEQLVSEGDVVEPVASLLRVAPDASHALNAASALALVGTAEDLPALRRAADPRSGFPDDVAAAARAAVGQIEARSGE